MGKSTKRKLPSNPDDIIPTMPRARIDEIIDEPPTPRPHEEDMGDVDYESEPEPEPVSLPKPHAKAVAFVGQSVLRADPLRLLSLALFPLCSYLYLSPSYMNRQRTRRP
jgi:hypothetical protein